MLFISLLQILQNWNCIDVRQFDIVRMSSWSLLIKAKFFNTFLRIKYSHLDLSILCVACKRAKKDFLSPPMGEFNVYL